MDTKRVSLLLERPGRKVLIYHTDLDGVCSATLLLKFFSDFELMPREGPIVDDKMVKSLVARKPDLIVILDIPMDQEFAKIEKLQKKLPQTRMIEMDHHIPEKDMNSLSFIHINPRFEGDFYIPASCMVYRMLEKLGKKVRPLVWIAAIGVIGDYGIEDCRDLFDECRKAYPGSMGENPLRSKLSEAAEYINSTFILHGVKGVEKTLGMMLAIDGYKSVPQNKYFASCREKVSREISRILRDFEKRKKEHHGLGLVTYRIVSRLNVTSTVSTMIAEKYPDRIIIMIKFSGQHVKISARCQAGDINLNSLMKDAVAGIGSGGGHVKAAGAVVGKKDFPEFERRLLERVAELRKTR